MNDQKKDQRLAELLTQEQELPQPGLWWLSFVNTTIAKTIPHAEQKPGGPSFLGVAIVHAIGPMSAWVRVSELRINPGGEIKTYGPLPEGTWDPRFHNRLLTMAEAQEADQAEPAEGTQVGQFFLCGEH